MAVQVEDFTAVGGLLNTKALWPRVTPTKIAQMFYAWLTDAVAKTSGFSAETKDMGTRAWVRFRAWDDVYQMRLGNPASVAVESRGSSGYTQGQIDAAKAERDAALLAFEDVEAQQAPAIVARLPGSIQSNIKFMF